MRILIAGTGGVGGYFGGKLALYAADQPDLSVYFIARGEHLRVIREQGLTLDCEEGVFCCRPEGAGTAYEGNAVPDLIILCVKSYDLPDVLEQLEPVVGDNTVILPLLNGVDIRKRIRKKLSKGVVLPACVYVGTHISKPGTILQRGGNARIIAGQESENHTKFKELFEAAGIACSFLADPYPEIWGKYIFITAFGLVTAVHDITLGELMADPDRVDEVKEIMEEINTIASATGVAFPDDIVSQSLSKADRFPQDTRTSFQRDYSTAGKRDEREIFAGTVIRLGEEHNIPVPVTRRLFTMLEG